MSMTDTIADLLTRIRNANKAGFPDVVIPHSNLKESIVRVLKEEGFVKSYEVVGETVQKSIVVALKYTPKKERVIEKLIRVSKPGRRVYIGYKDIRPVRQGLGVMILSTPRGVMTDTAAKKLKVGGEWLCSIW